MILNLRESLCTQPKSQGIFIVRFVLIFSMTLIGPSVATLFVMNASSSGFMNKMGLALIVGQL